MDEDEDGEATDGEGTDEGAKEMEKLWPGPVWMGCTAIDLVFDDSQARRRPWDLV